MSSSSIKFGFHIGISGGITKMPDTAKSLECRTIQIFSRNPRGWEYPPLKKEDAEIVKSKLNEYGIKPVVVHMPYLPNPASPEKDKYQKSVESLITEIKRADMLGAEYVNIHVGKRMDSSIEDALKRVIEAINTTIEKTKNFNIIILLENTAGQGSEIGDRFEHIKTIIDGIENKKRVAACLDTAHMFAAGYDLRTKQAIKKTFDEFDKIVGMKYLKCIHYNDSNSAFASKVDRHWHIGQGEIGKEGMKALITYKRLSHLPFIMETPKKTPNDDPMNLNTVKTFLKFALWE